MILRRRRLPADLVAVHDGFNGVLVHVETAKDAVMAAVPVARVAPRPLAEALFEFDTELMKAQQGMAGWRADGLSDRWAACNDALASSLAMSQRVRLEPSDELGFETFVGMIGDLIRPLEAFEAALARFEELKG